MIAWILSNVLFRNSATSAATGAVALLAALFAWHLVDKGSAVRHAVSHFVAATELAAAQSRVEELQNIIAATKEANRILQEGMRHAEAEAEAWASEIEAYVLENEIAPDGLVSSDLHRRLRAN